MAKAPSSKTIAKLRAQTDAAIEKKTQKQSELGKPFSVTGAGVVPEKQWRAKKVTQ